ncbi:MAG: hypothetical protein IJ467_05800, partial [Bacteroidaceae bacterium]|nr:hypothetical protein [Bacteroidaceae bacterium]
AQVLAENMVKWGHPDVVVTQNAPADFSSLDHFFDVILADVLVRVKVCSVRMKRLCVSGVWRMLMFVGVVSVTLWLMFGSV